MCRLIILQSGAWNVLNITIFSVSINNEVTTDDTIERY